MTIQAGRYFLEIGFPEIEHQPVKMKRSRLIIDAVLAHG
jgi:hypothetical protein